MTVSFINNPETPDEYAEAISEAYATCEDLEMRAESLLAEADMWRDRALNLEAESINL